MDDQPSSPSPILTKPLLAGRYEIRSLVGEGGIADVYSAFDRVLRRKVAVKVLREDLASDRRVVGRFRKEARAAASLGHPNIVSLHDVGDEGEVPFMVMELIPGETLSDVIWREAPLPAERAAEIGAMVADALAFAHARGIVHQDVKPANVMVSPTGQVKVLDFGIAGALAWTSVSGAGEVMGTAEYVSPEQARGLSLDGRSDVYSLGVVLYEMLTGRPPFEAESPEAVARMHIQGEPVPARRVRPELPMVLEGIVMRCLAKDPKARYQRAAQLAADLRRFQASKSGITAILPRSRTTDELDPDLRPDRTSRPQGPGRPRRAARPVRRRFGLALLLVVVAVVAAVAAPLFIGGKAAPSPPSSPRPGLTAPIGLLAKTSCDGFLKAKVQLTWFPGRGSTADGYAIYRSESRTGPFEKIELLPGRSTTTFVDPRLNTGVTFYYVARSTAGSRMSPNSAVAAAKTPSFCLL